MTEVKETEVDGRRVVFLTPDGKLPPRVEETGTWGFAFRESRSGGGSYLASLLTSAGVEYRLWGRLLDGDPDTVAYCAKLFGLAQRKVHGAAAAAGDGPVYLPCVATDQAYRAILALCRAAADATGGEVLEGVLVARGDFKFPKPGASASDEKDAWASSTEVRFAAEVAARAGRPICVVTDVLRTGAGLAAAKAGLQAALGADLAVEGLALFRRVHPAHGHMTTRELHPSVRARRDPASKKNLTRAAARGARCERFG